MSTWTTLNFQDAVSPIMEQLIMFHDHTMMIIFMITMIVSYMMISLMLNKFINRLLLEGQFIELIWTILPAFMLIFIALPSLKILYLIEEINKPMISIKSIGHQWFWSYEYSDFKKIEFDSYMKPFNDLEKNEFRLLDVDNRIILPFNINTRILVTSTDVIHSWTIPSMGIKIDASPGRINQGSLMINRPGLFFGQCSEICGANHSFMPIVIESINLTSFINWLNNY
uniref:Cytochrome c oxidase subunit 2 n=1 Tax=Paratkina nigrifasciana TaxID=3004265 RepID=A0A9E9G9S9_9HEMI|nr:cytochrome c oxidase subunit II [Paratkina nigrifasciana]WAP91634.1 cytochrome c oxidase subunit II [Paratkina nigrifasciana]